MKSILMQLTAICLLSALSEQLAAGSRLEDGVQLAAGLAVALVMLEAVMALPGALIW